jgi:putative transposase
MITSRPKRLDGVSYVGYQRYFVTACCAFRRPLFCNAALATRVIDQLLHNAALCDFAVLAYCLMPDHLHALVEAESEQSDFRMFVKRFKQTTGFAYRQEAKQRLWQAGYHERILRDEETTEVVVRYIIENPIRAGLTNTLGEYPLAGSAAYNLEALKTAWEKQT